MRQKLAEAIISIHALLAESDRTGQSVSIQDYYFYPRSPCGERQKRLRQKLAEAIISIHALLAESDTLGAAPPAPQGDFYPRSPCGERRRESGTEERSQDISIHALLAESDKRIRHRREKPRHFYPRSPCGERHKRANRLAHAPPFLSTLSLRRATSGGFFVIGFIAISIHALLAESDGWILGEDNNNFQISIHALLAESDAPPYNLMIHHKNFYPRSPCGERPRPYCTDTTSANFYPRSPCGERHLGRARHRQNVYFYPRSPCGERLGRGPHAPLIRQFLSTLSLRRATYVLPVPRPPQINFYPRSPCGERQLSSFRHVHNN